MAKQAKPFKFRGKWRIQVTLKNGKRPTKDFEKFDDAKNWGIEQLANANTEHGPILGGPKQAILAQALDYYARQHTITKRGAPAELNRINHYLEAVNMPLLKAVCNDLGGMEIAEHLRKALPDGWQQHNDNRRAKRQRTYEAIAQLASKRCSTISPADIRVFSTVMTTEGLSASTIQKEISMLKAVFNTAINEWSWKALDNPCTTVKLGKSKRRFVALSTEQKDALIDALKECDNPYFFPLVVMAKESTLRQGTLLTMTWDQVDVTQRSSMLGTKIGQQKYIMPLSVQELLANLPRHPSGSVFPLTKNAVKMNWNRARKKAGLPKLQFRDLRHLGATDWVRRGASAHVLKQLLGHTDIATAQFYVDLAGTDMQAALDAASKNGGVWEAPIGTTNPDANAQISEQRAERMAGVTKQRMAKSREAAAPPGPVANEAAVTSKNVEGAAAIEPAGVAPSHDPAEQLPDAVRAAWGIAPFPSEVKVEDACSLASPRTSNVFAFSARKRA